MAKKNQLTTSDHLQYDEYLMLLGRLHKDKEYLFELYACLSFCTALRASDVLTIRWKDVIDVKSYCATERKTGKTREIPLNASVRSKLNQLYQLLGKPNKDELVFKSDVTGKAITIQYINKKLKTFKLKYRLNIDHFSTHTFRKTFGRYIYDTNDHSAESLLLLNKILNHSNIDITKRYIGITKEEISKVFDSIRF